MLSYFHFSFMTSCSPLLTLHPHGDTASQLQQTSEYGCARKHTQRELWGRTLLTPPAVVINPTKSWHSMVQYLKSRHECNFMQNWYQKKKKKKRVNYNTSANHTKAMTGRMLWQEVTFMSGRFATFVCVLQYFIYRMICCDGTVGGESTASHSLAVMREIIG